MASRTSSQLESEGSEAQRQVKWHKQDVDPAQSACRDHPWMPSHFCATQDRPLRGAQLHLTTLAPLCPTGSDQWRMAERKLFNKGIAIYKKDFFLVQKLVSWGK